MNEERERVVADDVRSRVIADCAALDEGDESGYDCYKNLAQTV